MYTQTYLQTCLSQGKDALVCRKLFFYSLMLFSNIGKLLPIILHTVNVFCSHKYALI